jgi:hypothetical protein
MVCLSYFASSIIERRAAASSFPNATPRLIAENRTRIAHSNTNVGSKRFFPFNFLLQNNLIMCAK